MNELDNLIIYKSMINLINYSNGMLKKYPKIERNIERDKEVNEALEAEGWIVLRFWGKEIKKDAGHCADLIIAALKERN